MAVEQSAVTSETRNKWSDTALIISHDIVGSRMAGPGIRYLELARVLAQQLRTTPKNTNTTSPSQPCSACDFRVVLAVPGSSDLNMTDVEIWPYDPNDWDTLAPVARRARVILLCGDVLARFRMLEESEVPLVIDGYDPHTFETLALFSGSPEQESRHRQREYILQLQCRAGDFFICASERQRDWWLGLLEASGRINVHTYTQDPSLRRLVDVVPFGLRSEPPCHTRQVLKGVWPGIKAEDKVVLWGGGLWQWLDPLTAIRAFARVREQRTDVKLVFPGTRHPNHTVVPEMPIYMAVLRLAETLGLLNQSVFFGDWVPYEQWPDYLTESDLALSLHLDTAEARLAFRSRVLDYIWAGLPMVVTGGDATSELVMRYGLGEVVGYQDVEGVSQALLKLLDAPPETFAPAFYKARASLTWERAAQPLLTFCRSPQRAVDKVANYEPRLESLSAQEQELARLRSLVRDYESGRFIRFTKWLRSLRWRG